MQRIQTDTLIRFIQAAVPLITGAFLHSQYISAQEPVYIEPSTVHYTEFVDISSTDSDSGRDMQYVARNVSDELELIALVVEAEAANQGMYGKQLVVDVILNRVDSPDFPDSIVKVILQRNAFSTIWDGSAYSAEPTQETYDAIASELMHRQNDKILYFTSEGFSEYGTDWKKVGGHYFSTK